MFDLRCLNATGSNNGIQTSELLYSSAIAPMFEPVICMFHSNIGAPIVAPMVADVSLFKVAKSLMNWYKYTLPVFL